MGLADRVTVAPRLRVIGPGRAGRSLASALNRAGWQVVGQHQGAVDIVGPQGEALSLGIASQVMTPRVITVPSVSAKKLASSPVMNSSITTSAPASPKPPSNMSMIAASASASRSTRATRC